MIVTPSRPAKPREVGVTMVTDTGTPLGLLEPTLESYADFVDIAKFGVGSAHVEPRCAEKIALYKRHGVTPYFGGTLFEKYFSLGQVDDYFEMLNRFGIRLVEISAGTVSIPLAERVAIVKAYRRDFDVLAEVGCKDVEQIMSPSEWVEEITQLLAVGCSKVITEGRDSATAGVYRPTGEIREGLIKDILKEVPAERLIFEAPSAKSQMYFVNLIGPNVNLGNVHLNDLLLLESERLGLRFETFNVKAPASRSV